MPKVCVLLANGFEEIEAITIVDVLRRAEIEVVMVGVEGAAATGSHGISVSVDASIDQVAEDDWDMVVLPGGLPGATTLRDDPKVQRLLQQQHAAEKPLAAICAAPIALGAAGVLEGRKATCYPSFENQLTGATPQTERVVIDGSVTTSRGPGTAFEFSLELVRQLCSAETADELRSAMLVES